eukprot:GHVN01023475.1.p1 GENE.GHVN01023475.1~~GHVN01023475.1.p1  ORF type:complete len:266 (+),score=37.54 GHVN01023475.1:32-799(+)
MAHTIQCLLVAVAIFAMPSLKNISALTKFRFLEPTNLYVLAFSSSYPPRFTLPWPVNRPALLQSSHLPSVRQLAHPTHHEPYSPSKAPRVRFAPSPTSSTGLHLGGVRTAVFNYLTVANYNKRHDLSHRPPNDQGGRFFLRFEDTDISRNHPDAVTKILNDLDWLGLLPAIEHPFVYQSERGALYRQAAERLVSEGKAYRCFCSEERLATIKAAATLSKQPPKYDGRCLSLSETERARLTSLKAPFAVRFMSVSV